MRAVDCGSPCARGERKPAEYVEKQFYDGFFSHDDNARMDQFHTVELPQRLPVIGRLADRRLRGLGRRFQFVEVPQLMANAAHRDYDASIACRLMAADVSMPWLNYPHAIGEIDDVIATAVDDVAVLHAGHRDYLPEKAASVRSVYGLTNYWRNDRRAPPRK